VGVTSLQALLCASLQAAVERIIEFIKNNNYDLQGILENVL
jgi:hypothetical protein